MRKRETISIDQKLKACLIGYSPNLQSENGRLIENDDGRLRNGTAS